MIRTLDEMALIAGCYDLDAELRYIADSPAPEHGGFHPRVVAAARGAINVIAEARAEVAALRSEVAEAAGIPGPNGEADWDCLLAAIRTRGDDVAAMYLPVVAEVAALREGVELVREWQAAKHANHQAYDAWREVAVKNPGVRMPEVEKVYSTANECRAIESRLLAATLPEVSRG